MGGRNDIEPTGMSVSPAVREPLQETSLNAKGEQLSMCRL
jgi:hypothetical protein